MVKVIDTENPKLRITPSKLFFDIRHHNAKKPKQSNIKTIHLQASNKEYIDDDTKKPLIVRLKGTLPPGVSLQIGNEKHVLTSSRKKLEIKPGYKYEEAIPIRVIYDKEWKKTLPQTIKLLIGNSDEKGHISSLEVILNPLKDNTIHLSREGEKLQFDIPYEQDQNFRKGAEGHIVLTSKDKKDSERQGVATALDALPKGIDIRINGVSLGKTYHFTLDKPITIEIYRNRQFKLSTDKTVRLLLKDLGNGQQVMVPTKLHPVERVLNIQVDPQAPHATLDHLKDTNATALYLFADGKKIRGDALEKFHFIANCGGLNCRLIRDFRHDRYLLKIKPNFILGMTPTGEIPIQIQIEQGVFHGDIASKTFNYTIEDIGWKKWLKPLAVTLILLILLWYLWGITGGKKRFKKNQTVRYAPIRHGEIQRKIEREYHLRKTLPWWEALLPYRAQRSRVEDLEFIARHNRKIYLSKKSQNSVKHNGGIIEDPGRKDLYLSPRDTLKTDYALYTID